MATEEGLRQVADDIMDELVRELEAEVAELRKTLSDREWIPVGERLPPDNQGVIVWHEGTGAEMAYRQDGTWRLIWTSYPVGECGYTHWMPAPEPPTDVTEQT